MKYFRSQNLNSNNVLDHTVFQRSDGNIELNPTQKVILRGDLEIVDGNISGPVVTNVMYVTMDGDDSNDGFGEGPDQAKRTLKAALAVAQQGTTIFVRSGEYYEDNPMVVPPKVSIIGDNLRRTIVRPLNGPETYTITNIVKTNEYVTVTTLEAHGKNVRDRVRVKSTITAINETDATLTAVTEYTMTYRQAGTDITSTVTSGTVKWAPDLFHVNSQTYMAGMVFKGLAAPAYCINIDSDAIVDTSPYVQNCSNINGPWMRNGVEWLPFQTEQPDLNGNMVTGPRPLRDDEIQLGLASTYGIDEEGAGGGMLIDGDRYSSESPIKSMVADAFTQVSQGGVGFHITNFGYMQLVSCFAVFCSKAFYTTKGGYLSISNSVIDFGTQGFVADGYYLDPYATGKIVSDYYSSVGSVTVVTEGSGYDGVTPVVVTIDPPTSPDGVQATATANIDTFTGRLNAITIDNPGGGYDFVPNITISGGGTLDNGTAIANLAKNSTIAIHNLPNKPQVGSIMFIGNDTTAYYISNTVGAVSPFTYNETKCRRDSGIILDGIFYDVALGTNYNSVTNGLSYRRGMAEEVIASQLTQTVGAITYLKGQAEVSLANATAISLSNAGFDEIIDIIENGPSSANALTFTNPSGGDPNKANAKDLLVLNKDFIRAEIIAWIAEQISTSSPPFTIAFTYDTALCSRDVGYMIDALCYDILYGGNLGSRTVAQAYFEGVVSVLPTDQVAPTVAAWQRLSTVVQEVIQEIVVTTSPTNTETQSFSGSPATATEASEADTLLQIVEDVIAAGNLTGLPVENAPVITWASSTIQTAVNQLAAAKSSLVDNTILFIDEEYASVFTYDQQKCKRDVAIITNAVLTDMIFDSNYQSVAAGLAYLRSYSSKVLSSQKNQTIAGLTENRDAVLALTTNPTAISRITTNFNYVIDIIDNGLSSLPAITMPATATVRGGFAEAAAILNANRTFIQDEISAWIAVNYPTLSYDDAKCRRDISYIIDALRYDLIYEGNTQTVNAALAYVEGSVISGEVEETLQAYEYWKSIVGKIVRNEAIDRTIGNTTTQDVLLPVGSPVAVPNSPADVAESLIQIIINELDHGPGYIPDPVSYPDYSKGDGALISIRTSIYSQITDIQDTVINYLNATYGGFITVSVFPAITSALIGDFVRFHNVSTISTGGTALEYVGAGVTYNALPFFGGEPIPANERIEINNGKCFTVSNDQVGNYRIGEFFTVNALTGAVTIDAENLNLSGLAAIGPFKRNGIPVGVQLREVSNNDNLIASTGAQDSNTAPTQSAVATYVENRYLNKVGPSSQTVASEVNFQNDVELDQTLTVTGDSTFNGSVAADGGNITTTQTSFDLVNENATTVNFAGDATTVNIGAITGLTTINNDLRVDGVVDIYGTNNPEYSLKIRGVSGTGSVIAVETASNASGIGIDARDNSLTGYVNYHSTANEFRFNISDIAATTVQTDALVITDTGFVEINSNINSTSSSNGALVVVGGVGIGGDLNVAGDQQVDGNLAVEGTILSTTQTSFDLLNTSVTSLNFAKAATTIDIGSTTGTTIINHDLEVNGNVTLGDSTTDSVTINGQLDLLMPDNTVSAFELIESSNSYFKVDTSNGLELITFGSTPLVTVLNSTDATNSSTASVTFAGGVGIAKKLFVGTDLTVEGNTSLGNEVSTDSLDVIGQVDVLLPDNNSTSLVIRENLSDYLTVVTTNTDESVSIGTTPKLKVLNVTDSTSKDTGALIVEGGAGIEKNLTVGIDLTVDRDATVTRDLAVNGGDLTTTATTFNLINSNATTVNFAGAATAIEIGAATGTTNINNNLDVDGDVNIDGGDLTVSATTFNLANTTATTVNAFGDGTTITIGTTTGLTNIRHNLDVDLDLNVDGGDITTSATTFNLINANATTVNFAGASTAIEIGAASGTTNINHNLDVDLDLNVDGGDITTSATTFNLLNTAATTVNFAGDATTIEIGAATGTTSINHNLTVDLDATVTGDLAVNGGDLTTTATTFNLINANATTVNFAGAATTLNVGANGTINIGTSGSTVNIQTLTLATDLEVQYGGTGVGTFTTNGIVYGNGTGALQVTTQSDPGGTNATTSYGVLTTDASNVPVWTDVIDGGSY